MTLSLTQQRMSRRRWLRRVVGTAAAATAGGMVVAATPAHATPGDQMALGQDNDAGNAITTVIGTAAAEPVLTLTNQANGAALQFVVPEDILEDGGVPLGSITVDPDGDLYSIGGDVHNSNIRYAMWAYTTAWATMTIAIRPQRILDTRNAAGRVNIVGGVGNIDAAGRLIGGRTIQVAIRHAEQPDQVLANVTVAKTTAQGYVTVWGDGPRPGTSSLNFFGANQVLSNFVESPAGVSGGTDIISIFASVTTSVIVDVCGFLVADPAQVDPTLL
jgi:hypothetical protein